jgi:hypothetical protein
MKRNFCSDPTDSNINIASDLKTVPTTMQNRTVLLLAFLIALAETGFTAIAFSDLASDDFTKGNSSYNNSSISFISQNNIISAPVDLTAGGGYYSSHPIAVGTAIGSRTQLSNANSATSMSHEVASAREVSGITEYAVYSSSSQGEYENINSAATQMQIDETVTSGKVHIGVLSGDDHAGNSAAYPSSSAWKDPAIEIEEEYIGTYHITKNFAINNSYSIRRFADGWLDCCGGSYDIYLPAPVLLRADDVFNCRRYKSR